MSNDRVWMQVSSTCHRGLDDQKITCAYHDNADMVVIEVGTGRMYIPKSMAVQMALDLTAAAEKAVSATVPDADTQKAKAVA
jgi:hypothetical protein